MYATAIATVFLAMIGLLYLFLQNTIKNTLWFRSVRLHMLAQKIPSFKLTTPKCVSDEFELCLTTNLVSCFGLTIYWAPPGAGKTASVLEVCAKLYALGRVRGVVLIDNSSTQTVESGVLMRTRLSDAWGPILLPTGANLSDYIPTRIPLSYVWDLKKLSGKITQMVNEAKKSDKKSGSIAPAPSPPSSSSPSSDSLKSKSDPPMVIIIDHVERFAEDSDFHHQLKRLAEDAVRTQSYSVVLNTHDAEFAKAVWEKNGNEKIVHLTGQGNYGRFRMSQTQVDEWVSQLQSTTSLPETVVRALKKFGPTAGTPGFLVRWSRIFGSALNLEAEMASDALEKGKEWKEGMDVLSCGPSKQ